MPLAVVGIGEVKVARSRVSFSRCLCQETVWIKGQVGMPFEIGGHCQGWRDTAYHCQLLEDAKTFYRNKHYWQTNLICPTSA